ncbi:MAG TPA: S53 family peptidase [Solirubrobacteraceae bacterium]
MNPNARRFAVALALAGTVVGIILAAAAPSAPARAHEVVWRSAPRTAPPSATITFELELRVRERALRRYMAELFDPSSSLYGHYVSPTQFGRRFGIGPRGERRLARRLRTLGIKVVSPYADETAVGVRATAATVREVFGSTIIRYRGGGGAYYEPTPAPRVPALLARWVTAVSGLDTNLLVQTDDLPDPGVLTPELATSGYDVIPLSASGDSGRGQAIGLLSLGQYSKSDYEAFSREFNLPTTLPQTVSLSSISRNGNASDDAIEANLDVDVLHGVAPQAQIINYELDFAQLDGAIRSIVKAGKVHIVSASFGMCDGRSDDPVQVPTQFRKSVENALVVAAAAGVSFYFSTGDTGAYDCQRADTSDTDLTVEFPSDAPYAVAVGGTVLSETSSGAYLAETGWQDAGSSGGGGGGLNPLDAAPPWQLPAAEVSGLSNGKRQTPDVSAAAGDASPWLLNDGIGQGGWDARAGTSAATPFWAASMALVAQYVQGHGAGPVCFASPLLYDIAGQQWQNPPFHDVKVGGNRYYQAGPGWDFATGWGSPDVRDLATAIVAWRAQHPLPGGANACKGAAG